MKHPGSASAFGKPKQTIAQMNALLYNSLGYACGQRGVTAAAPGYVGQIKQQGPASGPTDKRRRRRTSPLAAFLKFRHSSGDGPERHPDDSVTYDNSLIACVEPEETARLHQGPAAAQLTPAEEVRQRLQQQKAVKEAEKRRV